MPFAAILIFILCMLYEVPLVVSLPLMILLALLGDDV